jgi:signal transduction histidine kinase
LIRIALFTVAYSLCAWLGRLLQVQPENLASFWLPSGVALAALLLGPRRRWPGLVLGFFAANVVVNALTGNPGDPVWRRLLIGAAFGVPNCLEPIVAAFLLERVLGAPLRLGKLREIFGLTVLAALLGNAVTAMVGAAVPMLAFGAPYWAVWRVWWIADALGMLLVTPVIVSWASIDPAGIGPFIRRRGVEAGVLYASMLVLAQIVFGSKEEAGGFLLPFPYVSFPFLLWAAVRFGLRGASVASLLLAVVAVWNTAQRLGPFAVTGGSSSTLVLSTQAFLSVVTLSALMLAAVIGERAEAKLALQVVNEGLEKRIEERTSELTDANRKLLSEVGERQRMEVELQRSVGELARSNAELEQFAYVASHDLREPLRAVAGMSQLLVQGYKQQLDAKAREYLSYIVDSVARGQDLIDDLLEFSRIGQRKDMVKVVALDDVLKSVMENLSAAIQESGAVVTSEGLPTLKCDPTQLTQLLQNLLGNAIKFRGEESPRIHVKAEPREGEWVFTVRDNGIGIEPQYFDRIFTIFQRLHTRRAYPGSGIGLAICKKIVQLHGGRIWVESAPGQGAAFHFTYPRTADGA